MSDRERRVVLLADSEIEGSLKCEQHSFLKHTMQHIRHVVEPGEDKLASGHLKAIPKATDTFKKMRQAAIVWNTFAPLRHSPVPSICIDLKLKLDLL